MNAGQYLTFKLNGNFYGINIRTVKEIKHMQPISALPDVPPYMVGVMNLRDHIIPIMDLRIRLGASDVSFTKDTCIIVTEYESKQLGLIVDAVKTVTHLAQNQIDESPNEEGFVRGIGKLDDSLVMLIETKNFFLAGWGQKGKVAA